MAVLLQSEIMLNSSLHTFNGTSKGLVATFQVRLYLKRSTNHFISPENVKTVERLFNLYFNINVFEGRYFKETCLYSKTMFLKKTLTDFLKKLKI